ncbi:MULTISPECIES: hypothetical protein [unclassified Nonomuraea]|uniref:hypothetical protein n=1 Tax=unclassified Nonomuraea TaxID=2593643 RepID=UPI0033D93E66
MRKAKQPSWPLLKSGQVSLFEPIPYGNDQRGRPMSTLLMFANVLIGSMPRHGKTSLCGCCYWRALSTRWPSCGCSS